MVDDDLDLRGHLGRLARAARAAAEEVARDVDEYARLALGTLRGGGRIFFAGNGGSAATAEHIATEYVVRLRRPRDPLPALALTASTSTLTAAANDFGYEQVFVRPLQALARPGDLLVMHSTSGNSPNLLEAARLASGIPMATVALLGREGGTLAERVDVPIRVPADDPACVQELHLAIEHAVADFIDRAFAEPAGGGGR